MIKYVTMCVIALNRCKRGMKWIMKTDFKEHSFQPRTSGTCTAEVSFCNRPKAPLNTALLGRERWTAFLWTYTQNSTKRLYVRLLSHNVSVDSNSQFSFTRWCERSTLSSQEVVKRVSLTTSRKNDKISVPVPTEQTVWLPKYSRKRYINPSIIFWRLCKELYCRPLRTSAWQECTMLLRVDIQLCNTEKLEVTTTTTIIIIIIIISSSPCLRNVIRLFLITTNLCLQFLTFTQTKTSQKPDFDHWFKHG
jgi:hypothetical protein